MPSRLAWRDRRPFEPELDAGRFWDELARSHPFHAVDNRIDIDDPDVERFWDWGRTDLHRILTLAGARLQRTDHVVEIGCGVGRITRALAERAASVRALDVSDRMLELAREHNRELRNVEWLRGDGSSLAGIDSASADAVFSHVVFQHIPDPAITLGYVREIGRVLRPGGWSVIHISNDPGLHRPGPVTRIRRVLRRPRWTEHRQWAGSAVDLEALRSAAADGGMSVERVTGEGTRFCFVHLRKL